MTFQGIAYVVDVWRGEHEAEYDLVRFLAFKAFFPQLVAGPIERASHLLDQFSRPRTLDADKVGAPSGSCCWLLLKIVVADSMAPIVDSLFVARSAVWLERRARHHRIRASRSTADFCGYSLIAKGAALAVRLRSDLEFQVSLLGRLDQRFLAPLAYQPQQLAARLSLHPARRKPRRCDRVTSRNLLLTMGLAASGTARAGILSSGACCMACALVAWRFLPVPPVPVTADRQDSPDGLPPWLWFLSAGFCSAQQFVGLDVRDDDGTSQLGMGAGSLGTCGDTRSRWRFRSPCSNGYCSARVISFCFKRRSGSPIRHMRP